MPWISRVAHCVVLVLPCLRCVSLPALGPIVSLKRVLLKPLYKRGASFTSLLCSLPIKGKKYLSCCLFLCAKHASRRALRVRLLRLRARRNEGKMKRRKPLRRLGLNTLNINWLFLREKVKRSVYARTTLPLSFSLCLAWISLSNRRLSGGGRFAFVCSFLSVFLSVV